MYVNAELDLRPYDAYDLDGGKNIWQFTTLKKIGIELKQEQFDNIKDVIQKASDSSELANLRHEAKAQAWMNEETSGKAVFDYMVSKGE